MIIEDAVAAVDRAVKRVEVTAIRTADVLDLDAAEQEARDAALALALAAFGLGNPGHADCKGTWCGVAVRRERIMAAFGEEEKV